MSGRDVDAIAVELRATAGAFIAVVDDLIPLADRLAELEAHLRAARHAAGDYHDSKPPARELALRPFVSFTTAESAERAEEALRS